MRLTTNPIVITTVDDSAVVRIHPDETVEEVLADVYAAIVDLYEKQDVVLEEFIECGELEIDGLPLNLQVLLFARLKHEIDGDEIYIEGFDGAFPTMKLMDYLESGPRIPEKEDDGIKEIRKLGLRHDLESIGRNISSTWGAECIGYKVDVDNKLVTFQCIEDGEEFVTNINFDELKDYDY